jgi:hypothetical protein
MNTKRKIELLAEVDGFDLRKGFLRVDVQEFLHNGSYYKPLPNYLDPDDHNPIQRIVDGMDGETFKKYLNHLAEITGRYDTGNVKWYFINECIRMHRATVAQQCEAVLKAKGLWEEG